MKLHISMILLAAFSVNAAAADRRIDSLHNEPVPASYWGMHIHDAAHGWPTIPFAVWRLWDAEVAWPQLEPRDGAWQFERLDSYVALADQHHVRILLLLGLSPQWASARPEEHSTYKPGNAAPPASVRTWRNYVSTVASRYKGRIHEYELWNEPNSQAFYSGTIEEMVVLAREASQAIRSVDPAAIVVSPSATDAKGVAWLRQFLQAGGGKYVDVIGYHFYAGGKPPEAMLPLIEEVKQTVRDAGVNKPIWNTETGWGTNLPTRASSMITGLAPAYVARSYVINWLAGIERFYWYAWDNHWWVTLEMTDAHGKPAPAAGACEQVRAWMLGKRLAYCDIDDSGTWACRLETDHSTEWVVWNPDRTATFRKPGTKLATALDGRTTAVSAQIEVGPSPLLLQ